MITNRYLMAPAPQSNASGTLMGLGHANQHVPNPPKWGVGDQCRSHSISTWHSHSDPAPVRARVRPAGPALAGPAGACPGFRFFVFWVSCPFGPPSASFRRTLRSRSRAIHARFRSGNAPPGPRRKYLSSPRSHTGRVAPAARPVGCLVLGPVFKYLLD